MSNAPLPMAVYHEHPHWFRPMFAELDRRGLPYVRLDPRAHLFNPSEQKANYSLVFNRMSPSAYLRGGLQGIFFTHAFMAHLERLNIPVVNGRKAFLHETSKALQLTVLQSLGLPYPRTRVINHPSQASAAAEGLRFPIVVKANVGGSGAGIVRFNRAADLAHAAGEGLLNFGVDHTALVQEFIPARDGQITRIETIGGEYLYGINVFTKGDTFNLCPADICQRSDGAELVRTACPVDAPKSGLKVEGFQPSAEVIEAVERIAVAMGIDVGGIEYMIDDRDGQMYFYDVNALSNFVADAVNVIGFDPHARLVDYLEHRAGLSLPSPLRGRGVGGEGASLCRVAPPPPTPQPPLPRRGEGSKRFGRGGTLTMRYGYWLPVFGGWLRNVEDEGMAATWDYVRRLAIRSERIGYDLTLIAELNLNDIKGEEAPSLDAWSTAAALAAVTERLELMVAVRPTFHAPALLAKQAANIDHISGGRLTLNVVSSWWQDEARKYGVAFEKHDNRYARTSEWLGVVTNLWQRDHFDFTGQYYKVEDAILQPKPCSRPRPMIYAGGESEAGKDLIARTCDGYVMHGDPPERIAARIADMDRRREKLGLPPLLYGVAAYAIVREDEDEARQELARITNVRASAAGYHNYQQWLAGTQLEQQVSLEDYSVSNRGLRAGLVGTPEQVLERIAAFEKVGVHFLLLQCSPQLEEMERFAQLVIRPAQSCASPAALGAAGA